MAKVKQSDAELLLSLFVDKSFVYDEVRKPIFHRVGSKVMRELGKALAECLGEESARGHVRSCPGGPGVLGEVILHGPTRYVVFYDSHGARGPNWLRIMWRTCKGIKDYTGGPNNWLPGSRLLDIPTLAADIARVRGG